MSRSRVEGMRFCGVVALLLLVPTCAVLADHCPDESIAVGRSETRLAGISFEEGKFPKVLNRYGPPTSSEMPTYGIEDHLAAARYTWKVESALLEVHTEFYLEAGKRIETVLSVRVDGEKPVQRLKTGRGLALGDPVERATRLYGPVYHRGSLNGPTLPGETRTFCFPDESELSIGVDPHGKITAIYYAPSVE